MRDNYYIKYNGVNYGPFVASLMINGIDPLRLSPRREMDYGKVSDPELIYFKKSRKNRRPIRNLRAERAESDRPRPNCFSPPKVFQICAKGWGWDLRRRMEFQKQKRNVLEPWQIEQMQHHVDMVIIQQMKDQ